MRQQKKIDSYQPKQEEERNLEEKLLPAEKEKYISEIKEKDSLIQKLIKQVETLNSTAAGKTKEEIEAESSLAVAVFF